MTRSFKKDKRKSCVSMYEYDVPNSNQSGYHSKYLKLVGTTIACTFIGILIFINYQKPSDPLDRSDALRNNENNQYNLSDDQPEFASTNLVKMPHFSSPRKITKSNHKLPGFRKRHWNNVQYATTSKQNELRHKLKNIQLLISDLKYFPR